MMTKKKARHIAKRIRALTKRLRSLSRWTIQLVALALILCAGTSALVIQHAHNDSNKSPSNTTSSTSPVHTSKPPSTTSKPTQSTSPTIKSSGTASLSTLPDQYGCPQNTPGYDSCVKYAKQNALALWCSDQQSSADDTYNVAYNQAQLAYNAGMAEAAIIQENEKNYPPPQNPTQDDYYIAVNQAKTNYNAIIEPAYAKYKDTINSLNSKGCSLSLDAVTYYVWPV